MSYLWCLARQNEKALNHERVRADTAEKRAVLADTTNRSHRGRPRKRTRPTRSLPSDDENIPDDDQVEDDSREEKMRRAGHNDGSTSHNPETFLHNKLVMHVAAAIIFGKQKARTLGTGKGSSSSSRCMQDIHQITRTTPGVVRNASVLTLWTLSADTSLKKCGQQTAVNWHLIGEQIHEWLLNGLRNRHEPVLRLFEWDDELFPDIEASLGAALRTGSANTEDLHEALEALSHTQWSRWILGAETKTTWRPVVGARFSEFPNLNARFGSAFGGNQARSNTERKIEPEVAISVI
ncbi:hypothetical protein B0H14DRAFT_3867653 [Mycena olivaceomarginata]|nr:hypothetical protein B0H14DRAFT_3867653 [Mycena olivaceomarginata]